ncbi:3-phosphoshikimate 1-carboxyvinyltransferase [Aurantibacter crassamenti]|uniref:3-phosphoshikimate 1-carboxyvinyltransferase n=1 Tax=Aurantibacter crassamenti TaxID=1837375 RepID=UPI00193A4C6B|nr:3-phosphoshikimate 1-carboxyvinyltransferase [Aurantibacter crassamenti]MBM1108127.1 3-phosphoshikimate 1-carboxyvinyltransferase [Aurantibacter crassamenti]
MKLQLGPPPQDLLKNNIRITGSKSESNRLLLLKALYPNISIENISNSDDAQVMAKGLAVENGTVDIHHAGTAMRFLTSYFASQSGKSVLLTGSQRMTERPIGVLVDALRSLGAKIEYAKNEGYPPLNIQGSSLIKNKVSIPANISSQYISSLLMVGASLPNGLELELVGKITSVPYIKMTLALLDQIGVANSFEGNLIKVSYKAEVNDGVLVVESDWSSASYFYSIIALSAIGSEIKLSAYKKDSLQGDSVLSEIYKEFGVTTTFEANEITLKKVLEIEQATISCDLSNAPDIAQTIAVTCFGLGVGCHLTGLHTLKIKETDRLEALHTELSKLGCAISVTDKSLTINATSEIKSGIAIDTYKDHRMAMAFAPLAMKTVLFINEAEVVSKSYPDYWSDLKGLDFDINEI